MINPRSLKFRALLALTALMAVVAFAATPAAANSCMSVTPAASSEMSAPMPTPAAAVTGTGTASSLTENAWLIMGAPNSDTLRIIHGVIGFGARDVTDVSTGALSDTVQYGLARIHDPSDDSAYEVRFTGVDRSSANSMFGGVTFFRPVFGNTGIGTAAIPKTVAYIAAWCTADVYKNGQRIGAGVPAHVLVTPGLRDLASGKMLPRDSIDLSAKEILLHVPGPVTGLPDSTLMAVWPTAALDLRDIGGVPMNRQTIAMAPVSGLPSGVVLGEVVELPPQRVQFSLRNHDLLTYTPPVFYQGYTKVTVVNNSDSPRGAIIKAKDVIGSDIMKFTPILPPGRAYSFSINYGPGDFTVMEYHGDFDQGMGNWKSDYETKLNVNM